MNETVDEDGDGEPDEVVESSLFHKFDMSPEKAHREFKKHSNKFGSSTHYFWGSKEAKEKYFSHKLEFDPDVQEKLE